MAQRGVKVQSDGAKNNRKIVIFTTFAMCLFSRHLGENFDKRNSGPNPPLKGSVFINKNFD
jgi:hypothetical protein